MPFCLKYFNILKLKPIFKSGINPLSTYGSSSSKLKFGYVKCKLDLTRNISSDICRKNFIPFEELIEKRRTQAKRSIIIEIHLEECIASLESLCCKFGNVKSITEFKSTPNRMILVEFDDENSIKEIFRQIRTNSNENDGTLLQTPFLKLNNGFKLPKFEPSNLDKRSTTNLDTPGPKLREMVDTMNSECNNVSEQIQYYYDTQKMRDLSWRLRFLTCRKIEWALPSVISHSRVIPFGSSVNTFGHNNCDLDMIIDSSSPLYTELLQDKNFPFTFQQNSVTFHEKSLNIIADLLMYYVPGFDKIWKIPQASVPIIKCKEVFTGLDCDITISNLSGYFMSEILYLYGCSDPRVRPLVFCVRLWAKEKRLTRKEQPGMWFSNFTMTMLVLFFLMNTNSAAVIPPLLAIEKLSSSSFTRDGIRYSYLRDVNILPESSNNQTLEELLLDFFYFYAKFNYKNAISLITGRTYQKTRNTALYIENPLELDLNVGKCVRYEHLECFKEECIRAVSLLSETNNKSSSRKSWGLANLLSDSSSNSKRRVVNLPINLTSVFKNDQNENSLSGRQRQGMVQSLSSSRPNATKNETLTINNRTSRNATVNPSTNNKKDDQKKNSKRGNRPIFHF